MKKLASIIVFAVTLSSPTLVLADEFDITMDVVGAEESFDEVIVNRIALPFMQNGSERVDMHSGLAEESGVLGEVTEMVDGQLPGAEVSEGMEIDSGAMAVENIPNLEC